MIIDDNLLQTIHDTGAQTNPNSQNTQPAQVLGATPASTSAPQMMASTAAPTLQDSMSNVAQATQGGTFPVEPGAGGIINADMLSPAVPAVNPYGQLSHYTTSVRGHMDSLLNDDSAYMQAARTRAQQQANSRGLLNSTMAATAGEQAAITSALPIAQQDAGQRQALQQAGFNMSGNIQGQYAQHVAGIQANATNAIAQVAAAENIPSDVKQSLIQGLQAQRDSDLAYIGGIYDQMSVWDPTWTLIGGATANSGTGGTASGTSGTGAFPNIPANPNVGGGAGSGAQDGIGSGGAAGLGGAIGLGSNLLQNSGILDKIFNAGKVNGGPPAPPPGATTVAQQVLGGGAGAAGGLSHVGPNLAGYAGQAGPAGGLGNTAAAAGLGGAGASGTVAGNLAGYAGMAGPAGGTAGTAAASGAPMGGGATSVSGSLSGFAAAAVPAAIGAVLLGGFMSSQARKKAERAAFAPIWQQVQNTPAQTVKLPREIYIPQENRTTKSITGRPFTDPNTGQQLLMHGDVDHAGTARSMWVIRLSDGAQGVWGINGGFQPMEKMVEQSRLQNAHPSADPEKLALLRRGGQSEAEFYEGSGYEA